MAEAMAETGKLYKIGEVSRITALKAFVLRYWETEFPMLRPVKSEKGQRLYREQDLATILEIKQLLYDEGFTIAGARKHLKENGASRGAKGEAQQAPTRPTGARGHKALREARDELRTILKLLDRE